MARQIQRSRMGKRTRRSVKVRGSKSSSRRSAYAPFNSSRGTNPQNSVVFRGIGFPDRLTTNLLFAQSFVLTPSAGTICPQKGFRMTSVYDPDYALGGGQPCYLDQLATVYSRYIVNGAKITATFSRTTTTAGSIGPYVVGIECSDSTSGTPSTDAGALISSPNTGFAILAQDDGNQTVVQTYSKAKTYPFEFDQLQARVSANPQLEWIANVFAIPQGVDVTAPVNVFITIEYNVSFHDVIRVVDV